MHTDPNCIFCKIVAGQIPSYKVFEDENFFAFLDIHPVKKGHTLLVPKNHIGNILETTDEVCANLFITGKKLAQKMQSKIQTPRIGFAVEGFGVNHVHLHLIPIEKENEINPNNIYKLSTEEAEEVLNLYKF